MVLKVEEQVVTEDTVTSFFFNVLSDYEGVRIRLVRWEQTTKGQKKRRRWADFGDDGTFVKRDSIKIPQSVTDSAKFKVINSLRVE